MPKQENLTQRPPRGPLVGLAGVTKRYDSGPASVTALDNIDLELQAGELVMVLGPSGSGKTTLLNIVGGLDRPGSGRVTVAGTDLTDLGNGELTSYRRYRTGFIFQFFNLVPTLTARENILLASRLVPHPRDTEELLQLVGLEERSNHFPGQLSGGEQQRVAVARALAKNPSLILADEPTGSLDSETGDRVLQLLRRFSHEEGRTTLLVTHNESLTRLADRVIRLVDGRVSEDHHMRAAAQSRTKGK